MNTHFSAALGQFTVEFEVKDLKGSNKVLLFKYLLEDLGIGRELNKERDAHVLEVMSRQFDAHWDK